jgi:tRNA pseudouridine55 synthase
MLLNVYKPKGWTSFDVIAKLRGILHTKKIGHAGTLDPLAEGVLVVLTEKDTKKQDEYMHQEKEYIADIALGLDSASYDLETELSPVPILMKGDLREYIGKLDQTVPPYSAVKVNGKKLYKAARKGTLNKDILPTKSVEIFDIEKVGEYTKDFGGFKNIQVLKIRISCSSGFYVRSFAHDIGGILAGLLRTKVGDFKVEDSKTLEDISKQDIIDLYKRDVENNERVPLNSLEDFIA